VIRGSLFGPSAAGHQVSQSHRLAPKDILTTHIRVVSTTVVILIWTRFGLLKKKLPALIGRKGARHSRARAADKGLS
jgi:hypothetical protein